MAKIAHLFSITLNCFVKTAFLSSPACEVIVPKSIERKITMAHKMEFPRQGNNPLVPTRLLFNQVNHPIIALLITHNENHFQARTVVNKVGLDNWKSLFRMLMFSERTARYLPTGWETGNTYWRRFIRRNGRFILNIESQPECYYYEFYCCTPITVLAVYLSR